MVGKCLAGARASPPAAIFELSRRARIAAGEDARAPGFGILLDFVIRHSSFSTVVGYERHFLASPQSFDDLFGTLRLVELKITEERF